MNRWKSGKIEESEERFQREQENYEKKKSLYAMSFCIEYGSQCMGTST